MIASQKLRVDSLYLQQSWPLWEQSKHFELGLVLNSAITDALPPPLRIDQLGQLGSQQVGCWECNLADESLIWSGGVYDIFGLPRGSRLDRQEVVRLYKDESRVAMESLRTYALRHRRGFTIDVEIQPAVGDTRWMRLIGAPILERGHVVKLHGLKLAL